ncbi:MAG: hypothetical protein IT318_24685 [Anaerolineales bacterium]|nr:hypothetical protein [Anaerolineales bacterium]
MSAFTAWSDYHAWPICDDIIAAARLVLPTEVHAALSAAAVATTGQPLYPREAIEDAALAMETPDACAWLEEVYELPTGAGVKLLDVIKRVRGTLAAIDTRPYANLAPSSPRAPDWLRVFGRLDHIPLVSVAPVPAELPGRPAGQLVYLLDVAALTAEQRGRLVQYIGAAFHAPPTEVEAEITAHGLPLLANDVFAVQVLPLRLLL